MQRCTAAGLPGCCLAPGRLLRGLCGSVHTSPGLLAFRACLVSPNVSSHPVPRPRPHPQILGTGTDGKYDPARHASTLNTRNPVYRDTVTVAAGGWAYVRFVADNPGGKTPQSRVQKRRE